ncbi:MAG: methylmalonyl Co-A mutase-associated GTPase MeaB [Thermoleophilia bacterium]|nr:methylmalonyl Co-A mutase-associated GTPase MeaB [Thermoleophilia bacterium]
MSAAAWTELLERARGGHVPSISRLISGLESRQPGTSEVLTDVYAAGGRAHVIGITGSPGAGKSCLVNALLGELRGRGMRVAVIAVDPSSSLTGGAILGDRIRMQDHALDQGVFVRSMATRGRLGGVSRATVDAVAVLDAAGWDTVIVETIGVGQDELEIVRIAHTTAIVSVPGLGDDIQAIKAGLLEVGDIHVVNKADRPGADRTAAELTGMLMLSDLRASGWTLPVLLTVALDGTGLPEFADALAGHLAWLRSSGELVRRERVAAAASIRAIAKELLIERIQDPAVGSRFDELVEAVAARRTDPTSAARILVDGVARPSDLNPEKTL